MVLVFKGGDDTALIDTLVSKGEEAEKSGNHAEADRLYKAATAPAIEYLQKVFPQEITSIQPAIGKYRGTAEPTIVVKADVSDADLTHFLYGISKVANDDFTQDGVIVSRNVEKANYGRIEREGFTGSVEPSLKITFENPLTTEQINLIDKVSEGSEIAAYTISPDGKSIETMRVDA